MTCFSALTAGKARITPRGQRLLRSLEAGRQAAVEGLIARLGRSERLRLEGAAHLLGRDLDRLLGDAGGLGALRARVPLVPLVPLGRLRVIDFVALAGDLMAGRSGAVVLALAGTPLGLRAILRLWLVVLHHSVAPRS